MSRELLAYHHRLGRRIGPYWTVWLEFEPRDCWIGVFWRRQAFSFEVFVCVLPCLPIHFLYWRAAHDQA